MESTDTIIAVFPDHNTAEAAVKTLAQAGFDIKSLSLVGKGYHTDEKVVGFYNVGDRVKFWGKQGAFWGGLWGLFLGGLFITFRRWICRRAWLSGHGDDRGHRERRVVGGLSALGAALYSIGVPKDSVVQYESALKADGFLLMAHGPAADINRAKTIFAAMSPSRLDLHAAGRAGEVPRQSGPCRRRLNCETRQVPLAPIPADGCVKHRPEHSRSELEPSMNQVQVEQKTYQMPPTGRHYRRTLSHRRRHRAIASILRNGLRQSRSEQRRQQGRAGLHPDREHLAHRQRRGRPDTRQTIGNAQRPRQPRFSQQLYEYPRCRYSSLL